MLSDSTLQHLLWSGTTGQSYGVVHYQGVLRPRSTRTPAVLEVLVWQFIRVLGETKPYPSESQELISFLKEHYYEEVSVRLIPLDDRLLEQKQKIYDWIASKRDDYGLGLYELRNDTIMSLQGAFPLVRQIYNANNCHFRPAVADQVIGLLLSRALHQMRQANPNAVHVLVVCSWNCTGDMVHSEMNATAGTLHL